MRGVWQSPQSVKALEYPSSSNAGEIACTKLLIFGNPKAGTLLMIAVPSIAIDLPLKILIWEDTDGKVWVSYNSPAYLKERYGLAPELMQTISVVETLATSAAE